MFVYRKHPHFFFIFRSQYSIVWILVYITSPLLIDPTFFDYVSPLVKKKWYTLSVYVCLQIIYIKYSPSLLTSLMSDVYCSLKIILK